ncbi:MAG: GNAT family N-acetyltransferase, partial [Bacteroidota bacterium]
WQGYQQSTYYSYVIDPLDDLKAVYQNISSNYRNNKIKKAQQQVSVNHDGSLEDFYRVIKMSFERQGLTYPFSFDYFQNYDAALNAQHARQLFFAVDEQQNIHSVAYLIWDQRAAYYHLTGDDPNLRNSGAGILLIWEAIQYTQKKLGLSTFDFEGSMISSIEKVRRELGAKAWPYSNIRKYNSKIFQLLHLLKSWRK